MADNIPIRMIKLQSSVDGQVFKVPETILASQSGLVQEKMAEGILEEPISVPNATTEVLQMVITYCEKRALTEAANQDLGYWDHLFVDVDHAMVHKILMAAVHLKMDGLCVLASEMIKFMKKSKLWGELFEKNKLQK